MARIGIRREDKSRWEARAPLIPDDVRRLIHDDSLNLVIQSSSLRAFADDAYRAAGADVADDLADCSVVLGVKEIPPERLEPGKAYVYFSHTIKGQPANMPALRRLMELDCQLIDYERIVDDRGRRTVLFGPFAGQAGMIDTLWTLGQRLQHEGEDSPFGALRPAHRYDDLTHAKGDIARVGERLRRTGLPHVLRPMVCGFAGYGAVSGGAQEVFDLLPVEEVAPADLTALPASANVCYKVVFKEEHMVERIGGTAPFALEEYYDHPDRYRAAFSPYLGSLTLLMNCIYWEPRYPRIVTREHLRALYSGGTAPRLRVIGDITCDVDGSIECTVRSTTPDQPVYVYEPETGRAVDGVAGNGPVVLAVDFLPCELPIDASRFFSRALRPLVPALGRARFGGPLADSGLPPALQRATIVYRGELTEPYRYLSQYVSMTD